LEDCSDEEEDDDDDDDDDEDQSSDSDDEHPSPRPEEIDSANAWGEPVRTTELRELLKECRAMER
jgi:hypothetical protein